MRARSRAPGGKGAEDKAEGKQHSGANASASAQRVVRAAKHSKAAGRGRAAAPRKRHKIKRQPSRIYRDIFDRLYANSAVDESVGIWLKDVWSPCWLWIGALNREDGYAKLTIRDDQGRPLPRLAHRVSFEEHMEEKLLKGYELRHLCHRRPCIHPNHVLPGTAKENTADQYARGTHYNQTREREREAGED